MSSSSSNKDENEPDHAINSGPEDSTLKDDKLSDINSDENEE